MGFLLVLKAELVRSLIIMRRYWFAALTGIIMGYGMLTMIIYAFISGNEQVVDKVRDQFVGPPETTAAPAPAAPTSSEETEALPAKPARSAADRAIDKLLGFLIGVFAFGVVGMFSQGLSGMAQSGELEQLCMSPHGLVGNFLARAIVAATSNIITSAILIALIAATIKGTLHFTTIPVIVLLALTFTNLLGFGFMVGGLTLVFKQTGQVAMIVRLVMLGIPLVAERIPDWPTLPRMLAHLLPITDASLSLRAVLLENVGYSIFIQPSFFALILSCIIWTSIGIFCFKYMENWSRDKGTLGAY